LTKAELPSPVKEEELLTYSQEYYILHKEELLKKRQEKEAEARFGDYSARLVKRPQKNFLWGFGTQTYDDTRSKHFNDYVKTSLGRGSCPPSVRSLSF